MVVDELFSLLESDDDEELELEDELGSDGGDGLFWWIILWLIHSLKLLGKFWSSLPSMGLWNVGFCCASVFVP